MDTVATSVRLPIELKEKLQEIADADSRSFNNLVVLLLTRAVKEYEQ